jgi:hypothetical protein
MALMMDGLSGVHYPSVPRTHTLTCWPRSEGKYRFIHLCSVTQAPYDQ